MNRNRIIEDYIAQFSLGHDVAVDDTAAFFDALVGSSNKDVLIALLRVWNEKGFSESELFNFATLMRGRMVRVDCGRRPLVDIVGTGAAAAKTFNVSTASALIIAGSGLAVAKHGNRAATSRAGSADTLVELGIDIAESPTRLTERLDRDGICFLFAPNHHALSPTLAAARRELGAPTIFNCLGPLCNPASPTHSLLGVSRREWLIPMANTLSRLGTTRSWVVHGKCGLDEIALNSLTSVAEVGAESVRVFEVRPEDFGISTPASDAPVTCGPRESAVVIESILCGAMDTNAGKLALMNAAAAIFAADSAASLAEAFDVGRASIASGAAMEKLSALRGAF